MLKAVIFDMDGVLIDSEPVHARAAVNALNALKVPITVEYCYKFIGSTTLHMLETIKNEYNMSMSPSILLDLYKHSLEDLILEEGYIAIPYVVDFIKDLKKNNIKLAIASSSSIIEIEKVVKFLGVEKYFDKLISGTTVSHPKPAPDVFEKAAKELSVTKEECIIIEDSFNGVTAANAAGIPVIGFVNKNSGNQDLSKATMLIEGFDEITTNFIKTIYQRYHNMPVIIEETERIILKELSKTDIPKLHDIYMEPEIRSTLPNIITDFEIEAIDNLDDFVQIYEAYIKNVYPFYGFGLWGIYLKNDGTLIGQCGLQINLINTKEEYILGYLLDQKLWGLGYSKEAINLTIHYAFEKLHIKRVVALISPSNSRSIATAVSVGMTKECSIEQNKILFDLYVIENNK